MSIYCVPTVLPFARYLDGSGVQRVQGGQDLKKSQHYPARFGMAICEIFLQHYPDIKKAVKANEKQILAEPAKRELKDWEQGFARDVHEDLPVVF